MRMPRFAALLILSGCLMPDVKVLNSAGTSKSESSQPDAAVPDASSTPTDRTAKDAAPRDAARARASAGSSAGAGAQSSGGAERAPDVGDDAGTSAGDLEWSPPALLESSAEISWMTSERNQAGDVAMAWRIGSESSGRFKLRRFVNGAWASGTFAIETASGSDVRYRSFALGMEQNGAVHVIAQAYVWYEENNRTDYFWRWKGEDGVAPDAPQLATDMNAQGNPYALIVSEDGAASVLYAIPDAAGESLALVLTERISTGWGSPQSIGVLQTGVNAMGRLSNTFQRDFALAMTAPNALPQTVQAIVGRAGKTPEVAKIELPHPTASGASAVTGIDDAGNATLLTRLSESVGNRIYATRAQAGSNQWSAPERISDTSASVAFVSVSHGGDTLAFWFAGESGTTTGPIVARAFKDGAWGKSQALTGTVARESVQIAQDAAGSHMIVWAEPVPAPKRIRYLRYKPNEGWRLGTVADYTGKTAISHVSLDDAGRALVIWSEATADATRYDLKWSRSQ